MKSGLKLTKNLTILGPPGSGKGFYGRYLAQYFNLPLLTASSILRSERPDLDLSTGKLIDCQLVSETLRAYVKKENRHYLMDGFPRTPKQIQLMEETWPIANQVHFALKLDIPDEICEQKMLGRRKCLKCNKEYNVANVQTLGFDLPPTLPDKNCSECVNYKCNPSEWVQREDDVPHILRHRLKVYRDHERPVVDFYERQGRLFRFTPTRGARDVPKMEMTVEKWLQSFE